LYWKYQDRGLSLVGVALDEKPASVESFVAQKGIFWPEICDGKADAGEIPKLYNVSGTPDLYVIDRAGNIAARVSSAKLLDRHLAEVATTDPFPARTQRDSWQRPNEVMERLGVRPGSAVADVGAGGGYFTFRLAGRVGPDGKVFAQDLDRSSLDKIADRAQKENLPQVKTIQGTQDDPKLPGASLDAILVVDAFHEFTNADAMTSAFSGALKPGGRLGVLDRTAGLGLKTAAYNEQHHIPPENLISLAAASGLRLISFETNFSGPPDGDPSYYVIFEKSNH
jgi:predicted methyltransferase